MHFLSAAIKKIVSFFIHMNFELFLLVVNFEPKFKLFFLSHNISQSFFIELDPWAKHLRTASEKTTRTAFAISSAPTRIVRKFKIHSVTIH